MATREHSHRRHVALKFKRRDEGTPSDHSRLPIQLERLPFATLDATDDSRVQLSLTLVYGDQVATWEASATHATWEATVDDPAGIAAVLPGPFGNDMWVALGRVWNSLSLTEQDVANPEHRTITLGYFELLGLMAKTPSQTVYTALEETVLRLGRVTIVAQGTWKDGEYVRERVTFPLFEMTRTRTRRDGNVDRNTATFRLSLEVARALVRHSRLLNTRELYRLRSPAARRLYRLLEAERFNRDRQGADTLTLTLAEIRDRMPLAPTKPAHLKRTLDPAHKELYAAGLLTAEPGYATSKQFGSRAPIVSILYRFPVRGSSGVPAAHSEAISAAGTAPIVGTSPPAETAFTREQLANLVGGTADPSVHPVSDLTWWVREIERATGDTRSSGFYKQVVEAFAQAGQLNALEFVLRGVERDGDAQGAPSKARGIAFTIRIKTRAQELGVKLPDASKASNRSPRGLSPISDLMSPPPKR